MTRAAVPLASVYLFIFKSLLFIHNKNKNTKIIIIVLWVQRLPMHLVARAAVANHHHVRRGRGRRGVGPGVLGVAEDVVFQKNEDDPYITVRDVRAPPPSTWCLCASTTSQPPASAT